MSGGIPSTVPDMSKSDFLVKTREELHFVDRRFHIPARCRSVWDTIQKADGEWLEGGQTMTILRELVKIEEFLWENRHESDTILQPKVWEAIELSRQISSVPTEFNRRKRKSMVVSVTVGYTGLVDCWVLKTSQRSLNQARRNPWAKSRIEKASEPAEVEVKPASLELENRVEEEDFVMLVQNNILDPEIVMEPVEDESSVEKSSESLVDEQPEVRQSQAVEPEIVLKNTIKKQFSDDVMIPDEIKALVNEVIFLQEG